MQIFIKILFSILLFFLPLSFAGTENWSFFIFQSAVTFMFCYMVLSAKHLYFSGVSKIIIFIFSFLIFLGLLQSLNFHNIDDKVSYFPFSLCPFYTLKETVSLFTYLSVFILVTQFFQSSKQINNFVPVILAASVVVMVTGLLYQKGEYIKFFLYENSLGSFGPFVNRNSAGAFLSLSFFISSAFLLSNIFRYKKEHKKKQESVLKLSFQSILTFLFFISIIFVRSRGVYLATFLSLFFMAGILSLYIPHNKKTKILCILTTLFLFAVSSVLIYKNLDAINAYTYRKTFGFSEQARLQMYDAAFDMLKKYPVFGTGQASFPVTIKYFLKDPFDQWVSYLHNDWLELLLGIGYPQGIFVFILIIIFAVLQLKNIKNLKRVKKIFFTALGCGLLSFAIASGVDFHFHIPADAFLFFIVLALMSALTFHKSKISTVYLNVFIKILLIAVSLIFLYFSYKNAVAWRYETFARNLTLENKIEYYQKAVEYSCEPRYLRNLIFTYYNSRLNNKINKNLSVEQKNIYSKKANFLAREYLKKYPYDKQISKIYLKTL